jgi:hypothetical protein
MARRPTHVYAIPRAITAAESNPSTLSRSKHWFLCFEKVPAIAMYLFYGNFTASGNDMQFKSNTFPNIMIGNTTKCYYTDVKT